MDKIHTVPQESMFSVATSGIDSRVQLANRKNRGTHRSQNRPTDSVAVWVGF
jgi:hypothetical protein